MSLIVLDKDGGKLNLKSGSDEIYLKVDLLDTIKRLYLPPWGPLNFYTEKESYGYWDYLWETEEYRGTEIRKFLMFINRDPTYVRMYFYPGRGWIGTLKTEDMWPYDRMNGMLFIDWGENPYDD